MCNKEYHFFRHSYASLVPTKHWYSATVHSANYCIFPASIAMKSNCLLKTSYGEEDHQCVVSSFHYIEEWFFDIFWYGKWVFVVTWQSQELSFSLLTPSRSKSTTYPAFSVWNVDMSVVLGFWGLRLSVAVLSQVYWSNVLNRGSTVERCSASSG